MNSELEPEDEFDPMKVPHLVLAWLFVDAVEEILEVDDKTRRLLLNKFSEMGKDHMQELEVAFKKGFDAGYEEGVNRVKR